MHAINITAILSCLIFFFLGGDRDGACFCFYFLFFVLFSFVIVFFSRTVMLMLLAGDQAINLILRKFVFVFICVCDCHSARLLFSFFVFSMQLYKRLCPSVGRSVGRSVRNHRVRKWEIAHFRPCPPVRNWWPCIRPCLPLSDPKLSYTESNDRQTCYESYLGYSVVSSVFVHLSLHMGHMIIA